MDGYGASTLTPCTWRDILIRSYGYRFCSLTSNIFSWSYMDGWMDGWMDRESNSNLFGLKISYTGQMSTPSMMYECAHPGCKKRYATPWQRRTASRNMPRKPTLIGNSLMVVRKEWSRHSTRLSTLPRMSSKRMSSKRMSYRRESTDGAHATEPSPKKGRNSSHRGRQKR